MDAWEVYGLTHLAIAQWFLALIAIREWRRLDTWKQKAVMTVGLTFFIAFPVYSGLIALWPTLPDF